MRWVLIYELVDDDLERRAELRAEHLGMARAPPDLPGPSGRCRRPLSDSTRTPSVHAAYAAGRALTRTRRLGR